MTNIDLLDPDKIKENLKTNRIGKQVLVFKQTSSTNDIAAEYAKNSQNDGLVILAEEQTAGRGRAGSKWLTGHAESILCSIVLTNCNLATELLPLTCAVAVAEAIGKTAQSTAKIKWPNDIILNGRKVAGILLESRPNSNGNVYILGIGINCHQQKDSFPPELQTIATSIDIESRTVCDRISLTKRLLTSIDHWLQIAEKNSKKVIDHWSKLSKLLHHRTTLLFNGKKYTGYCTGIDPEKGLILQLDLGATRFFDAVHTTIEK